jgi:hypothetical protein
MFEERSERIAVRTRAQRSVAERSEPLNAIFFCEPWRVRLRRCCVCALAIQTVGRFIVVMQFRAFRYVLDLFSHDVFEWVHNS